jgi:hypothetical protein
MVIKEASYRVEVFVDSYAQETWDDKLTADKIEISRACSRKTKSPIDRDFQRRLLFAEVATILTLPKQLPEVLRLRLQDGRRIRNAPFDTRG